MSVQPMIKDEEGIRYEVEITSEEQAFKQFVLLTIQKRELKEQLEAVERDLKPLGEYLLTVYEIHPGKGPHTTHGYTVYQAHETWARSGADHRKTVAALLDLGYDFDKACSINTNFLSGIVREYKKDGVDMSAIQIEGRKEPIDLTAVIVVDEKIVVRARKA